MTRDITGVEKDARLVGGFVEFGRRCHRPLLVPDISAIKELHSDKCLVIAI